MANQNDPLRQLRNRILQTQPLKIVLGAGDQIYPPDWICTNVEELDITNHDDWCFLFEDTPYPKGTIDYIFAEHVLEHLTEEQTVLAVKNIYSFIKPGGTFRVAVPDGYFPLDEYIEKVKPGGTGAGAKDHKVLWNYESLSRVLEDAGFQVNLLEYWDRDHKFNYKEWDKSKGKVLRSLHNDERNTIGEGGESIIRYTSVIIDAVRPLPMPDKQGILKAFRRRDIEGRMYFNIDDFIGIIGTCISLNKGQLKEALEAVKVLYLKVSADLEGVGLEKLGEYPGEKLLDIESTIEKIANEIVEVGEHTPAGGAHKICIDMLIQLMEAKDQFSDN